MKRCPHCGGVVFKAYIRRPGLIQFVEDDGVKILKEGQDKFDYQIVQCIHCHEQITNEQLIEGVPCSKCQTITDPADLIDGLCPLCYAEAQMPDLVNASKEDLIRMIVKAQMSARMTTPTEQIEKKMEKATDALVSVKGKELKAVDEEKKTTGKSRKSTAKQEAAPEVIEPVPPEEDSVVPEDERNYEAAEPPEEQEPLSEPMEQLEPVQEEDDPMADLSSVAPPEAYMESPF